jgi:secretion/DNA translocation related TadE-like protein
VAFLGLMAAAGLLLMLVLALGGAVTARHRAGAAADLAALAAAGDPATGCASAARVAAANSARLVGCERLPDGSWLVTVVSPVAGRGGRIGPARGVARAGNAR